MAQKFKSDDDRCFSRVRGRLNWLKMGYRLGFYFTMLKEYGGVNFTRIDLALDDYDETVKFADIEKKLNKGHYRSSRKSIILLNIRSKRKIIGSDHLYWKCSLSKWKSWECLCSFLRQEGSI